MGEEIIHAAGGVVWRPAGSLSAPPTIALVHRPKYDDWTLPKGKLNPGEYPLAAAVREVWEETAIHAVPQARLPSSHYRVTPRKKKAHKTVKNSHEESATSPKVVDYWSMRARVWHDRSPDHEVDAVEWFSPEEALTTVTYDRDRVIIQAFIHHPRITHVIVVARGDITFAPIMGLLAPTHILSSTSHHRIRLATAVASASGGSHHIDPQFDDNGDPATAINVLISTDQCGATTSPLPHHPVTIICADDGAISKIIATLTDHPSRYYHTQENSGWLLAWGESGLISATTIDPPPLI